MAITFTLTARTTLPIEAECIRPDTLRDKSTREIESLPCLLGNRDAKLADLFAIRGDASDGQVVIEGDGGNVKWIGAGMTDGQITIHGRIGMHLGSEMQGGRIIVEGDTGDWVGAEMRGGFIHVRGRAGHLVGAGYRGSRLGMRGGTILVDGDAGNEIGSGMRRGLIAVAGSVGDFAGASMIAGSLFLFSEPGIRFGAGMKRGTIALLGDHDRPTLLPTFRYSCTFEPPFLPIYLEQLQTWGLPIDSPRAYRCVDRYNGDFVALGKGEILIANRAAG